MKHNVSPAKQLVGIELPTGWKVLSFAPQSLHPSGGLASYSYIVERNGEQAFLKALDYFDALRAPNTPLVLENMTRAFNFESEILSRCASQGMRNVVLPLETGSMTVDHPIPKIDYLILELGTGDARKYQETLDKLDTLWVLRTLHGIANGLRNLHAIGVAHQDVKLSNVIIFDRGHVSKVGDLGSASRHGEVGPNDGSGIAGDGTYAPIEQLYGLTLEDWSQRRRSCDLYLLGSLSVQLFTGGAMTPAILSRLAHIHRPGIWGGSYEEVLPYVRSAFAKVVDEFSGTVARYIPSEQSRRDIVSFAEYLCDPDPSLRGHPRSRASIGSNYSLERFVSGYNLLVNRVAVEMQRLRS